MKSLNLPQPGHKKPASLGSPTPRPKTWRAPQLSRGCRELPGSTLEGDTGGHMSQNSLCGCPTQGVMGRIPGLVVVELSSALLHTELGNELGAPEAQSRRKPCCGAVSH